MEARQSILENSSTEDNESFSAEQLVKHKEKELQTLVKIKEYTQEILGQLKFRVQTFEKYDTILAGKQKVSYTPKKDINFLYEYISSWIKRCRRNNSALERNFSLQSQYLSG